MKYEPGIYMGELQEAGIDTLNNEKHTPFMYLTFAITHRIRGEEHDELPDEECANRDVKFWTTDKALEGTEAKLSQLGFNGDYGDPVFSVLDGQVVRLICQQNGNYEEWEIAGIGAGRSRNVVGKDAIRKLNAQWKNHQGGFAEQPTSRGNSARAKTNAEAKKQHKETTSRPSPGDDVPF